MSNYQWEESVAIEAVIQAARVCQKVRADLASEETLIKKDRSPVTVADFSSQAIISCLLKKSFPDDPVVAEESASDLIKSGDDFIRERVFECVRTVEQNLSEEEILQAIDAGGCVGGPSGRFWTLDPIDGTKGFLRGEQYAVSLALIENGQVVLGVLGCPNYPEDWRGSDSRAGYLFAAIKGQGAYQQTIGDSEKRPIHVSDIQS
ncbi:MAG: inositol monophosphatase family protein, partial [Candidatus Hinthialibacter sp.]